MFATDPPPTLLGGLLLGIVFGFLLQKGGVSTFRVIVGQFLFTDHTVLKVMLTAICVGGVGVYTLLGLGLIDGLLVKPAYLVGVATGGLIFGVGMSSLGYCPGTAVAAVAQGSRHALVGILGGIVGAALYSEVYPTIDDTFLTLADYGKVTIPELLGVPAGVPLAVLAAISLGVFALITRAERANRLPENA